MDSLFGNTKKSEGGASDGGVSDLIQTAASSYFKKQGSEDESASSPPTQHDSSSGSGEKMKPSGGAGEKMKPSGGDAAGSAKVLLDAAVARLHKTEAEGGGEGEQIDNAKLASAAADVLGAAKHYGKMEDGTGYGKYVDTAEGYLQKFGQKQGSGNVAGQDNYARPPSSHSAGHAQEDDDYEKPPASHSKPYAQEDDDYERPPASHSRPQAQEDDDYERPQSSDSTSNAQGDEEENKYLNYLKKAEGYLNKN